MKHKTILSALRYLLTTVFIFSYCQISSVFAAEFPVGGGLWNTNLRMINILELENPTDTRQAYTVQAYDNAGVVFATHSYSLAAHTQRDINLNDAFLQGHENQTGIIAISGPDFGDLVGRISYYRWNLNQTAIEFAFSIPAEIISIIRRGTSVVQFNSIQPSFSATDADATVDQWLSIANFSLEARQFTINTYDQAGVLINTQNIYLRSGERRDIIAGDTLGTVSPTNISKSARERAMIGTHEIVASEVDTYYVAQLVRYGHKGGGNDEYAFAVPILSTMVEFPLAIVPISGGAGADNYVELTNTSPVDDEFVIMIIGYDGIRKVMKRFTLTAHQQVHFNVGTYLNDDQSGLFAAGALTENSGTKSGVSVGVAATGISYYRNINDGTVKATSAVPVVLPFEDTHTTSYNLYLDSENWLRLFNLSDTRSALTLKIADETGDFTEKEISIQGAKGVELPLHDFAEYNTAADTFGEIVIEGNTMGEMVRVGGSRAGDIDFVISTPVGYIAWLN